jgi:hypothetical protein
MCSKILYDGECKKILQTILETKQGHPYKNKLWRQQHDGWTGSVLR